MVSRFKSRQWKQWPSIHLRLLTMTSTPVLHLCIAWSSRTVRTCPFRIQRPDACGRQTTSYGKNPATLQTSLYVCDTGIANVVTAFNTIHVRTPISEDEPHTKERRVSLHLKTTYERENKESTPSQDILRETCPGRFDAKIRRCN